MLHGKISGFMLFESVGFTLTVKNSWNTLIFFDQKRCQIWICTVSRSIFTGHLVYACVEVALISRNDNSLIMRRESILIHQKILDFITKTSDKT